MNIEIKRLSLVGMVTGDTADKHSLSYSIGVTSGSSYSPEYLQDHDIRSLGTIYGKRTPTAVSVNSLREVQRVVWH